MALSVGQRLLAPTAIGAIGGATYGGYEKYEKGNFNADVGSSASTGALVGMGVGALSASRHISAGVSKRISQMTLPVNSTGATS